MGDLAAALGHGLIGLAAVVLNAGGHIAGGEEARVVHVDDRLERGRLLGQLDQPGEIDRVGAAIPLALALLDDPQAHDVLEQASGAVNAALVGVVGLHDLDAGERLGDLRTQERPGSGADVGEGGAFARGHGGHGGRGVVRADGDHGHLLHAHLVGDLLEQQAAHGAGGLDLREHFRGQAELFNQAVRPVAGVRVDELAGGGDGVFGRLLAGQEIGQQIGHEEHGVGHVQRGIAHLLHGEQLIKRVKLHEGQAGFLKDFLLGHDLEGLFHHVVSARVAVVDRNAQQSAVFVQQAKIDAPGVDADAVQLDAGLDRLEQRGLHFKEQALHVPHKAAVQHHRIV